MATVSPQLPPPSYDKIEGPEQHSATGPTLQAAGTRTVIIHQDNEANRPVAPVTEESALLAETTEGQANSKKVFSFERFVFLWLGIGHFYAGVCLLICMLLFGWGIAVVAVAGISTSKFWRCKIDGASPLLPSALLCIISGILFTVLGGLWPISYGWSRKKGRNFTMLGFLVWLWFLLFFCVTVALGIELYEHRYPLLPCEWLKDCKSTFDNCGIDSYQLYTPMVTTASMLGVILVFVFFSSFCLCCARKKLGRVC